MLKSAPLAYMRHSLIRYVIAKSLKFAGNGPECQVHCIGHIINLIVKAFLFGEDTDAINKDSNEDIDVAMASHRLWQRQGPVGKLHNLVTWISRSDHLTQAFLRLQRLYNDNNPGNRVKVVHLVPDNATRWLSQYYMIHWALATKIFIEDLCDEQIKAVRQSNRSDKQLPPCLQPNARLTDDNWALIIEGNEQSTC